MTLLLYTLAAAWCVILICLSVFTLLVAVLIGGMLFHGVSRLTIWALNPAYVIVADGVCLAGFAIAWLVNSRPAGEVRPSPNHTPAAWGNLLPLWPGVAFAILGVLLLVHWTRSPVDRRPGWISLYFDFIDRRFAPRPPVIDNGPLLRRIVVTAVLFEFIVGLLLLAAFSLAPKFGLPRPADLIFQSSTIAPFPSKPVA